MVTTTTAASPTETQQPQSTEKKKNETDNKKGPTYTDATDAAPNNIMPADTLISQATQHETEAEQQLLRALDDERRKRGKLAGHTPSQATLQQLDGLAVAGTASSQEAEDIDNAGQASPNVNRRAQLKRANALAARTFYLQALHEDDEERRNNNANTSPAADPINPKKDDDDDLVDASASERIHHVSSVLQAAASSGPNFGKNNIPDSNNNTNNDPSHDHSATQFHDPSTAQSHFHDESHSHYHEHPHNDNNNNDIETPSSPPPPQDNRPKHPAFAALYALPRATNRAMKSRWEAAATEWSQFHDFFGHQRHRLWAQFMLYLVGVVLPCLLAALILFYALDNPPTGRCKEDDPTPCAIDSNGEPVASSSYWVLFLGVRQVIIWLLARFSDLWVIDWLLLQHAWVVRLLGPRLSLVVVQSKGWPSVMFWWGIWDLIFLWGDGAFAQHWLFWQDTIKVFTRENPPGNLSSASWHRDIMISAFVISISVAIKRALVGMHLGKRLYGRFNERLQDVMKEITLVTELAMWARRKRDKRSTYTKYLSKQGSHGETHDDSSHQAHDDSSHQAGSFAHSTERPHKPPIMGATTAPAGSHGKNGDSPSLADPTSSISSRNGGLPVVEWDKELEPWDEPSRKQWHQEDLDGNHIIEFRQAFSVMTKPYFFSSAFGPVDSREECIESADRLFRRLRLIMDDKSEDNSIQLEDLLWWMFHGYQHEVEQIHANDFLELLQPDCDGRIDGLQFVKTIDAVYKRVRLLENSVNNASHIDRGYEKLINIFFYFVLGLVVLAILSLETLTFVISLSALILAFSFMIGSASSQIFEGVMLVLGRQPYDVGDRVAFDNVRKASNSDGSQHWMVENIRLTSTTCRLTGTNEVASFSNGAIARSRIINMNRSPEPCICVYVRFGMDVPYSTVLVFKAAVEKFVEDRPQEWVAMTGFRAGRVEAEQNFVEYVVVLKHRLSWQSLIPIKESKAAVTSFCVEIQKQLDARYIAPPMPVEIRLADDLDGMDGRDGRGNDDDNNDDDNRPKPAPPSSPMEKLMEAAKQFVVKKLE